MRYRKKPEIVNSFDAIQYTGNNLQDIEFWIKMIGQSWIAIRRGDGRYSSDTYLWITDDGKTITVAYEDWILYDIWNGMTVCNNDKFKKVFEEMEFTKVSSGAPLELYNLPESKHFIQRCERCKAVITQCRCPGEWSETKRQFEEKQETWGICEKCK